MSAEDYEYEEYEDLEYEDYEYDDRPRNTRKRIWVFALLLFLLFVFFLPNLVLMTPLKNSVVKSISKDVQGTVVVDRISAGWFSSVHLSGVKIHDTDGNEIITAETVKTSKTLLSFLTDSNLGSIAVSKPKMVIQIRKHGSNIEDIFDKYINAESTGSPTPEFEITIDGGIIELTNQNDNGKSSLSDVSGTITFGGENGFNVDASGKDPANEQSNVQVTCHLPAIEKRFSYRDGKLHASTQSANASILGAVLTRIGYQVSMTGSVSGKANLQWTDHFGKTDTELDSVQYDRAIIAAPDYIGTDQLTIRRIQANGMIGWSGKQIKTKNLVVQSDVGSAQATGTIDLAQLSNLLTQGRFTENDFQASGAIDIAALARMLPNTIHLHQGVVVDSGKLTFQSFSRIEGINRRLMLNAEIQNIVGRRQNQSFHWQQPIRVTATARQNENETTIENATLELASVNISGSGSLKQADFTAKGDLGKLASDLNQFIDLSQIRLAGKFAGRLRWTPTGETTGDILNQPMDLQSSFRFTEADINIPGFYRLREPVLDFQTHARGQLNAKREINLETGTAILTANDDQLKIQLSQPVKNLNLKSNLVGHVDIKGQAGRWHERMKPFLPDNIQFTTRGNTNLSADVVVNTQKAFVKNINGTFEQFAFDGYGLAIREPKVIVGGQLAVDLEKNSIEIPDATLSSSSIAARANNSRIEFGKNFRIIGATAFRANVGRISGWIPSLSKSTIAASGSAEGTAKIETNGSQFHGVIDSTIKQLRVTDRTAPNKQPLWDESAAKLQADFSTSDFEKFTLKTIVVQSKALSVNATGTIDDIYQTVNMNLSGQWQPDWNVMSKIASAMSGQKILVRGNAAQTFVAQGPLFAGAANRTPATTTSTTAPKAAGWISPDLKVETKIAWQNAEVVGLPLGATSFPVKLERQYLKADQLKMNVGSGQIDIRPGLDLRSTTPVIHLRSGSAATNIQLTPETCAGFLKYIAPPVADATRAQGTFSVSTTNAQLPISNPLNGLASGTVEIKNATLQSGPLADQILGLAKSIKRLTDGGNVINNLLNQDGGGLLNATPQKTQTWVTMPTQKIPFQMQKGRVYHEGATFQIDDVTIKTRGSVGADQTVQLIAAVPVLDKWIAGKSWLQSLRGQTIQVPIKGTLTKPQLDTNVMRQLSTRFLRQNLGNTLQQKATDRLNREIQKNLGKGVEEGLKKLFGK